MVIGHFFQDHRVVKTYLPVPFWNPFVLTLAFTTCVRSHVWIQSNAHQVERQKQQSLCSREYTFEICIDYQIVLKNKASQASIKFFQNEPIPDTKIRINLDAISGTTHLHQQLQPPRTKFYKPMAIAIFEKKRGKQNIRPYFLLY